MKRGAKAIVAAAVHFTGWPGIGSVLAWIGIGPNTGPGAARLKNRPYGRRAAGREQTHGGEGGGLRVAGRATSGCNRRSGQPAVAG